MVAFATQVKRRRGTAEQNNEFTGAEGEIVVNLTDKSLRVHDGQTKGGFETLRQNMQNSVNIANCITEIPQDIKLELNNGTLTLKAGSKVYVPNGVGVFDVITIQDDIVTTVSYNGTCTLYYDPLYNQCSLFNSQADKSGTTDPTTTANFYNTEQNLVKRFNATALSRSGLSFPLCRCTTTTDGVSSIDVVFNGFGYIGSTIFALPGVKGLIPNGRNADGSLKNNLMTVQNVITKPIPSNTGWHYITINSAGTNFDFATNYYKGTELPSGATTYSRFYNMAENMNYNVVSGELTQTSQLILDCYIDHSTSSPYKINSIKPITVFHAVDYNDTEYMAHQAMPSNNYIDLTLGGNWAHYQAPADGYFFLQKDSANALETIRMLKDGYLGVLATAPTSGFGTFVYMPVSKGEKIQIAYTVTGVTKFFRFVYANGAQ